MVIVVVIDLLNNIQRTKDTYEWLIGLPNNLARIGLVLQLDRFTSLQPCRFLICRMQLHWKQWQRKALQANTCRRLSWKACSRQVVSSTETIMCQVVRCNSVIGSTIRPGMWAYILGSELTSLRPSLRPSSVGTCNIGMWVYVLGSELRRRRLSLRPSSGGTCNMRADLNKIWAYVLGSELTSWDLSLRPSSVGTCNMRADLNEIWAYI